MTPRCDNELLYDDIETLLKRVSDEVELNDEQDAQLREAISQWQNTLCPEDGKYCRPGNCSFRDPVQWAEFFGYPDLYSLVDRLDPRMKIKGIPRLYAMDPLDVPGARRPGHYNP